MARQDRRVHRHVVRTRWGLWPRQRANILRALLAVEDRAKRQGWSDWRAFNMAVMVVTCGLTESRWHVYGNVASSESYRLADYVPVLLRAALRMVKWIGSDHDSVGCFQQRTSWGTFEHRMDPKSACHAFMDEAGRKGVDKIDNTSVWLDIQAVQVSFDSTGHNYEVNVGIARKIVAAYWDRPQARIGSERHRRIAQRWEFSK